MFENLLSSSLLLYDNHPDHTRLLMRKAKVSISARHRECVAVVAAGRDEARVKGLAPLGIEVSLGFWALAAVVETSCTVWPLVHPLHGFADFYRDVFGRVEWLRSDILITTGLLAAFAGSGSSASEAAAASSEQSRLRCG